jgi:hypothetical protein
MLPESHHLFIPHKRALFESVAVTEQTRRAWRVWSYCSNGFYYAGAVYDVIGVD